MKKIFNPKLKRPQLDTMPLTMNDYLRSLNTLSLDQMSTKDFRTYLDRKLPNSDWKNSFLEPLQSPAMRKKKMESMTKQQQEDYLHWLQYPNPSGRETLEGKTKPKKRIHKDVLRYVRKIARES